MKFSVVLMALMAFHASLSLGMSLGNADDSEEASEELLHLLNNQNHLEKRGFDPSDPRSLFQHVYSNYSKRKFGPTDPRSLFSAVYSNYK